MRRLIMSRLIRIYAVCHSDFYFRQTPIYISGIVQIQGWKGPLQELKGEMVKQSSLFAVSSLWSRDYMN